MPAQDPLTGLDDVDWGALRAAYGPAEGVPGLLRDAVGADATRRAAALRDLWGTVWHQGTVYTVTPVVVPFLTRIVADHRLSDGVRAEIALLLASTAAASSFVVDDRYHVVAFARDEQDPVPAVELDRSCRDRLAAVVAALDPVLTAGPWLVRAATVGVAATVASALSADARAALAHLADGDDPLVATAAGVVLELADGAPPTPAELLHRAAVDEEGRDFLEHIPSWPPAVQAVELVRVLCERAVAGAVGAD